MLSTAPQRLNFETFPMVTDCVEKAKRIRTKESWTRLESGKNLLQCVSKWSAKLGTFSRQQRKNYIFKALEPKNMF